MKRIGLLGCGSIGSQIAIAIDTGKIPAQLTHIFDEDRTKSDLLLSKLQKKPEIVENVHLLSSNPLDLVVEAASQRAVSDNALSILGDLNYDNSIDILDLLALSDYLQ